MNTPHFFPHHQFRLQLFEASFIFTFPEAHQNTFKVLFCHDYIQNKMGRLKILHYGFGAPELFASETVAKKGNGDGFENSLRNLAAHNGLAYLTSPQIGLFWKTLVMLRKQYLVESKWEGYKNLKNSYFGAYLNFQIEDRSKEESQVWQQFVGYPGLKLLMLRSQKIKIRYQTERKFQQIESQVQGFQARIMQQASDQFQALDPLMLARDISIVNQNLKKQHEGHLKELLVDFVDEKKKITDKGQNFNYFKRIPSFNKMRREVIFSITDFYRK